MKVFAIFREERMKKILLLLVVTSLIAGCASLGRIIAPTGGIYGKFLYGDEEYFLDLEVRIGNKIGEVDEQYYFWVLDLPVGDHDVVLYNPHYGKKTIRNIEVRKDKLTLVSTRMPPKYVRPTDTRRFEDWQQRRAGRFQPAFLPMTNVQERGAIKVIFNYDRGFEIPYSKINVILLHEHGDYEGDYDPIGYYPPNYIRGSIFPKDFEKMFSTTFWRGSVNVENGKFINNNNEVLIENILPGTYSIIVNYTYTGFSAALPGPCINDIIVKKDSLSTIEVESYGRIDPEPVPGIYSIEVIKWTPKYESYEKEDYDE